MELMQWNDVLATGIITIDNQHKYIVELTNQLGGAIERGDVEIVEHVLKDLVDYTVYHFSFEEELMEKAGYTALPLHRRVHQLFTARVLKFQERYAAGEDVLEELHGVLVRWLLGHIQNEDRDYAESVRTYLIEHINSRFSAAPPSRFATDAAAPAAHGPAARMPQQQPQPPQQPPQPQRGPATRMPAPGPASRMPRPAQQTQPAQAPKPGLLQRVAAFFMEKW